MAASNMGEKPVSGSLRSTLRLVFARRGIYRAALSKLWKNEPPGQ
jgi:hypothetical protein